MKQFPVEGKRKQCLTCIKTFILSRGAVPVRLTAPAAAPATRCFHQRPELFSSSVNSSGMAILSPMSSTWRQRESSFLGLTGQCCQAHRSAAEALLLLVVGFNTDAAVGAVCKCCRKKSAATALRGVYLDKQTNNASTSPGFIRKLVKSWSLSWLNYCLLLCPFQINTSGDFPKAIRFTAAPGLNS